MAAFLFPVHALQRADPLARHFFDSSAVFTDRDFGSGGWAECPIFDVACSMEAWSSEFDSSWPDRLPMMDTIRYGEALHPGPAPGALLTVGVSNPSGLRRKEDVLLGLGPGIWGLAETQLSESTFRTSATYLTKAGRALNREVRLRGGSPAPLRQGSTWAGTWSGVAVLSDTPVTKLDIPWPIDQWESGRVMLTRHWANTIPITIGTFYGYAQGPTWPQARQLSDQLLEHFTTEVVLGMSGVRILMGDYNFNPGELVQQQIWLRHGWQNLQTVAESLFQHTPVPTCKGVNERGQIWLSPEAIQLLRSVRVQDDFGDHSTVMMQLQIPEKQQYAHRWPRPAKIPWRDLRVEHWSPICSVKWHEDLEPTEFMSTCATSYEQSLANHLSLQDSQRLPQRCFGRATRRKPDKQTLATPTCRPSREGEVVLQNSMAGVATRQWFKQLRRLQSMKHAVHAGKDTMAALNYRQEVWQAIRQAAGFTPYFLTWWTQQTHQVDGVPLLLPQAPPHESIIATSIYDSFLLHFRRFEAWHLKERSQSLRMKYAGSLGAVYMDLRDDPKPRVDTLWKEIEYTVLAVDPVNHQLQLDQPIQTQFDSVWIYEGHFLSVTEVAHDICAISMSQLLTPGDALVQKLFLSDTSDVLHAFEADWRPRWNNMAAISTSDWDRIVGFGQHYLPALQFRWEPLNTHTWTSILRKFKKRAARGPDGFDVSDLKHVPESYTNELLGLIHSIETQDTAWPDQLAFGTVVGLSKVLEPHEEVHYRPITLFSVLYRAWARIRTKQFIKLMSRDMPPEALGFLPRRETTEIWMLLQGQIELMLQTKQKYAGLSTDLKRAFNNIGRQQVFFVANRLGLPQQLLRPWQKFLNQMVRRFDVNSIIGDGMQSSSGFPEGCPLSILAMLNVNWCFHIYMKTFCPNVVAYSFVDNLTLAAREAWHVAQAYFALRAICQLFGLTTDDDKTYVWALDKTSRLHLRPLGFQCLTDANELGGAMTYGLARRTRILRHRGQLLEPTWNKLRKSLAPKAQKLAMLSKVFWPKALHGSANCLIADNYAAELRRAAVKAVKLNGAGSNPMLRLTLADDMQADPGFYQLRLCVDTCRRMLGIRVMTWESCGACGMPILMDMRCRDLFPDFCAAFQRLGGPCLILLTFKIMKVMLGIWHSSTVVLCVIY